MLPVEMPNLSPSRKSWRMGRASISTLPQLARKLGVSITAMKGSGRPQRLVSKVTRLAPQPAAALKVLEGMVQPVSRDDSTRACMASDTVCANDDPKQGAGRSTGRLKHWRGMDRSQAMMISIRSATVSMIGTDKDKTGTFPTRLNPQHGNTAGRTGTHPFWGVPVPVADAPDTE